MDNYLLRQLESRARPIRVGVVGAGRFAAGLFCQIRRMTGIEICVASDVIPRYAAEAFGLAGYRSDEVAYASSAEQARVRMELGQRVVLEDPTDMPECDIDVVVDVTGLPRFGAELAYRAIANKKHVVMVNIEADCAVGPALRRWADRHGVVYTLADGDQPSLAKGLYDWAQTLGLEVTMLGKWTTVFSEEEAERLMNDPDAAHRESDIAYLDGSKNQIEMACIANMTGFLPDVPGMHKPRAPLAEIPNLFRLRSEGGILGRERIIDVVNSREADGRYSDPALRGGVFMLVTSPDEFIRRQMGEKGLTMSRDLRYGIVYRPHHLIGIETPISIVKAVVLGEATGSPRPAPAADVVAVAKRAIRPGERIDGIGKHMVKGIAVSAREASEGGYLPLALAEDVYAGEPIPKGTRIRYSMLKERGTGLIWQLRRQLEAEPQS